MAQPNISELKVKIGTYNIQNTVDSYSERRESLKNVIKEMDCDILSLQEVDYMRLDQIKDLELQDHMVYFATPQHKFKDLYEIEDDEFNIDGNVICLKKEFYNTYVQEVKEEVLYLSPVRVAHLLEVKLKDFDECLLILNNHLHHCNIEIQEDMIRLHQIFFIEQLLKKRSTSKSGHTFWMGDFNAFPHERTYSQILSYGYKSSFEEFAGKNPEITWPANKEMVTNDPKGCMDYIFIKKFGNPNVSLSVENALEFGDKPVNKEKGLYPSDHTAIRVDFKMRRTQ